MPRVSASAPSTFRSRSQRGEAPVLREDALRASLGAQSARRFRSRSALLPVLRSAGGEPRPRHAAQSWRPAHVGQRGGRVSALQHQEARRSPSRHKLAAAVGPNGATPRGLGHDAGSEMCPRRGSPTWHLSVPPREPSGSRWSLVARAPRRQRGRYPRKGASRATGSLGVARRADSAGDRPGSSQRSTKVDLAAAGALGFDVVTRRSGGGAVVVVPGEMAWIDVIVPAGDALWDDDVTRASYWLGELWADVVAFVRSLGHGAPRSAPGRRRCSHVLLCGRGLGRGDGR